MFKCNDKRYKICRLYIIACSEFELANKKQWKVKKNISCRSRNFIHYLKSKLSMYEPYKPYIGKAIGDHIHGLKTRMNNHITVYIMSLMIYYIFNCIKRNNKQLVGPFFVYTSFFPSNVTLI